jgi:cell fate regulator YaaT (PSP1 superfamily)
MTNATGEIPARPRISVKFSAVGRVQRFLLPEFAPEPPHHQPGAHADGASAAAVAEAVSASAPTAATAEREPGSTPPRPAFAPGDTVVVRTLEGPAVARVVRSGSAALEERSATTPAPQQVMRRATEADITLRLKQEHREREAYRIGSLKVRERGLVMKLSRVEHAFDGSRLIFYFTADGRIDFRELVRDLAAEFRMRIEMRQIGVRDEARMLGGYGSCGRPLCCTTWLQSFEPVSIKMAKQQNLSLNPSKLSGLCGRLKCCLRYELPNGKGEQFAGCAQQGSCSGGGCSGDGQCGTGDGGCGGCGK